MLKDPTLLMAGLMTEPHVAWMRQALTTDWTILSWTENDPFEEFVAKAPRADAIVAGRIRGAWPAVPRLGLYQIPFAGHDWIGPGDVPAGCTVCNTFEHEITIAEYVLGAMLEREIDMRAVERRFRTQG